MLSRQRVKAAAHAVELLRFVQNRVRMHWVSGFPENLRRENFRGLTKFREPERGFAGLSPESNFPAMPQIGSSSVCDRASRAYESIPSLHHRAKAAPKE